MGFLHYDAQHSFAFEDRLLNHLRTVILSKLNLHESVVFTWAHDERQHTIWLHPSMPLHFEFDAAAPPELNPAWIERLVFQANAPGGLRIVEEPPAPQS